MSYEFTRKIHSFLSIHNDKHVRTKIHTLLIPFAEDSYISKCVSKLVARTIYIILSLLFERINYKFKKIHVHFQRIHENNSFIFIDTQRQTCSYQYSYSTDTIRTRFVYFGMCIQTCSPYHIYHSIVII